MQSQLITTQHRELLMSNFGKTFEELEHMDDDALDEFLMQELAMAECDEAEIAAKTEEDNITTKRGQLISEIIDIICGPYDPEEINGEADDDE